MSGTEAGREAIAEEFTLLVERAMDQMDFIQPLKDMIKRTKEHDIKVNDRLLKLENESERHEKDLCQDHDKIKNLEDEVKELRECLKSGDLPKDNNSKDASNPWHDLAHGDIVQGLSSKDIYIGVMRNMVHKLLYFPHEDRYIPIRTLNRINYTILKKGFSL